MENNELLKKIEALEKKVSELEKKNVSMFGRSYSQVGNSNSDFLIKTRGQVKIQWGSKFIDLIKDGKVNADSKVIFTAKSKDQLGVKDGIYIVGEEVYFKINGQIVDLARSSGNSYVSFLEEQKPTSENRYLALQNIGFLYPSLTSLNQDSLQNGIIYIESESKLYIVKEGQLTEYTMQFPNPYTEQFIIQKKDEKDGALLIKGSGISNSLAFDTLYIFTEQGNSYIRSNGTINIQLDNINYIEVTKSKTGIRNLLECDNIQSKGAKSDFGYQLYMESGQSNLIIDNLTIRNSSNINQTSIYPTYYSSEQNVITNIDESFLTLKYPINYKVGDCIYTYSDLTLIPMEVLSVDDDQIEVKILLAEEPEELNCVGRLTFLIHTDSELPFLQYNNNTVDLCISKNNNVDVQARYGQLSNTEFGVYARQGYFTKVAYEPTYQLDNNDSSANLASTEWVRRIISSAIPVGTITAFHGDTIPSGWAICDGNNGTPNLIGKFIKAGTIEEEGGESEVFIKDTDIPKLNLTMAPSAGSNPNINKLIPTFDKLEEFCVDSGGLSNYCLYTGVKRGDNGLGGITVGEIPSLLDFNYSLGQPEGKQTGIKIEPKYYSLVFIMKIE